MNKPRSAVISWCLYDWANSAFATTIMAAVLPIFYSKVAAQNLPPHQASSYWGYTNTIGMLIIAFLSPVLGTIADMKGSRKKYLGRFAFLGIVSTSLLILAGPGDWLLVSLLYILGKIGFGAGNVFYDSLLPFIAEKEDFDRVSTLGYAIGYLGGGLLLIVNLAMITKPQIFGLPNAEWGSRCSFLTVSVWWAIFSIPLFMKVHEPPHQSAHSESEQNPITAGFRRLAATFHQVKQYKEAWKFLLAYWLYNDGISTIIIMATIFGTEIGISQNHLIGALVLVQLLGIPFTLLFAQLTKFFETKTCILIGLAVYTLISIAGFFMRTSLHFWLLAIMVALAQGGCQALSRSLFGRMMPDGRSAEFFAFYDISSKFAGIMGPALFGLVGQMTGSSRYGIISLVIFFLLGGFLLNRVDSGSVYSTSYSTSS